MKRILTLSLIVLLSTVIFSSCEEELSFLAKMSANIDGESWTTVGRTTIKQGEAFIVTGTTIDGEAIILTINGASEDTYVLNPISGAAGFGAVYKASIDASIEDTYISTSGELVLSEVDTENSRISGTFSFEAKKLDETINITEGKFEDLKYTAQ